MHTENISRHGVLIACPSDGPGARLPRIGQLLTVELELPEYHGFGRKCIHCQGTVVRVSVPGKAGAWVALSVNHMDFRAYEDRCGVVCPMEPALSRWMA